MKTYSQKPAEIKREWFIIDLKGKTLGKVATEIANILRGKNKPTFSPHVDCGDYVIAINAKEIKLTGNKLEQKTYYRHSQYPGSLKQITASKLKEQKPEKIIINAVNGMLPKNKLRKEIIKKLKVFPGSEHTHEAQKPKILEL